ncbi:1-acyl-sn-glycerol-3-phosphate acyltransferase [Paenibacillus sp. UNCCL117]|uniref:lysophospholipid acyltransferase family protein n=1 Tax=unclassified Paenibacillus TaxID=185978 RepID=UPI00087EB1A1|nr:MULTISPECIES: lysophospholipid acyltransferase family protein [unclassified Paenibacillus]SDC39691.1 1-acyl-sn-glycerol-3-phosphate acyltransferase [Paenibacillus sp. cl123]SFW14028.1 1-acyl-sn-glycerol-3-phosphate acyltransferase [Paenibacillus sp. UNCCL117]
MLYRFLRGIFRLMFSLMFRVRAEGQEHIPATGGVVLCANHTSNWDPPMLGSPLERKVHYMAKAELFALPVLKQVLPRIGAFPVKRGGVSKDSIRLSLQLLRSGEIIGVFPEGTRSNAGGMGKKGAASLAIKSGAAVIPAAIIGNYSLFRPMKIVYGPPIDLSEFADAGSEGLEQATDKIMSTIRQMVRQHASNL